MKSYILIIFILFFYSCTIQEDFTPAQTNIEVKQMNNISKETLFDNGNLIIVRDNWGTPHIFGKKDSDAAFGLAYAHSEDDFKTIHDLLLHVRGKYASVYGSGKNNINASLDYLIGLLKIENTVTSQYEIELSEETQQLCQGYANGINYYIESNNNIEQFIYPVKAEDIAAGFIYKMPFFFDLPLFISALYSKKPEEIPESFTINDKIEIFTKGSNVFAVSPLLTDNNSTFLAINSHQPWEGDLAWYEAHIYSDEGWNMSGGLFPGSPVVLVGFNENLGWGHTVNAPDILDIYQLEINPDNENQYLFDGKWLDLEQYDVNINIKTIGKFSIDHKEAAFWSVHGPVIKGKHATYAIRYSWDNNIKTIEQWYYMNKAKNFKEWNEAMSIMALPMFNAGYADKEGNIFYIYNAKLPIRKNNFNWNGVIPGNTSETLWKEFVKYEDLPQILNPPSGFIQNCNNTPYYTTKDKNNNPTPNLDESIYSGIETKLTNRSLRAMQLFSDLSSVSYDDFKNIKFDLAYAKDSNMAHYVNKAKGLIKDSKDRNLSQAFEILNNWDLRTDISNANAALPIISFGKFVDSSVENISDNMLIAGLKNGINYLNKKFGKLKVLWGDINKLIRGDVKLSLAGGPDILRAIYPIPTKEGYLKSIAGDAYMALVQWDNNGNINSESIHQFGSAILDDKSVHYSDQAYLFSKEKLKPAYLDIKDILKHSKSIRIIY